MSADIPEIQRAVELLINHGEVVELRIPKAGRFRTVSGYYNDHQKLSQDAAHWSGQFNVYVTLNRPNPDLLARSANKFLTCAEHTTKDEHIEHLRWLLVDADPVRPAGISSSDAEHEAAIERVHKISEWLQSELGFPAFPIADSGNGGHLLLHVDLPNTPNRLSY